MKCTNKLKKQLHQKGELKECGAEMSKVGDVITDVVVDLERNDNLIYTRPRLTSVTLYQCPQCKTILLN